MKNILVMGAGKIGTLVAFLLADSDDYHVYLADINTDTHRVKKLDNKLLNLTTVNLDAANQKQMAEFIRKNKICAIACCLPYYQIVPVIKIAGECNVHYFDLTEDINTTQIATQTAQNADCAFVPQCGLAPGFINIVANDLMQHFPKLDSVKMRVGALPINISNGLQYSLTWSTDGLINEYGNLCQVVEDGKEVDLLPLNDLEEIKIDGLTYEAFNTSGGAGTLVDSYKGKVKHLSYKTIRYPGHCAKMRFLMNDLRLNEDRSTLKRILENSIPKTYQDVVLVYVSVTGKQDQHLSEENYVRKFYPKTIHNILWSAIQLTTASSLCAIVDTVLNNEKKYKGFIKQEQFSLKHVTQNRFGKYFDNEG